MSKVMQKFLMVVAAVVVVWSASGQSLDEMRRAQKEARAEIERITATLQQTQSSQRDAQGQLKLLRSKITERKKMLTSIEGQLRLLDGQLGVLNEQGSAKASEYQQAVRLYCSVVETYAAALRTCPRWGVHAARLRYYTRTVADTLAMRATVLKKLGTDLTAQAMSLAERRAETARLEAEQKTELSAIEAETIQAQRLTTELGQSARTLSVQQKEQQKRVDALETQIRAAVAKEVARTAGEGALSETLAGLSKDFANNKGKLPNPLARGSKLADSYGLNQVHKGVTLQNKGVNLRSTTGDGRVVAVFEGTVSRVFAIMGLGQCVLVRHGAYFTVYSGLTEVAVTSGEAVAAGSSVGRVAEGETLHFELWKATTPLNPAQWIKGL